MSANESNKECHLSNNDTLSNCLKIMANTKKNTHMPSSHGAASKSVRDIKWDAEMSRVSIDVDSKDYFDELYDEVEH